MSQFKHGDLAIVQGLEGLHQYNGRLVRVHKRGIFQGTYSDGKLATVDGYSVVVQGEAMPAAIIAVDSENLIPYAPDPWAKMRVGNLLMFLRLKIARGELL